MTIEDINEVESELERFKKRLSAMKLRAEKDSYAFNGCAESGALKRSAMDLKVELNKLTKK